MFTQPGTPGHTQPKYGDLWPFTGALLGAFPSRCPQPIGVHAGLQPSLSHPPEQNRSVRSPKMGCFSLENSHGQRDMFFFVFSWLKRNCFMILLRCELKLGVLLRVVSKGVIPWMASFLVGRILRVLKKTLIAVSSVHGYGMGQNLIP